MSTKDEILAELTLAEQHINTAKVMIEAVTPPPPDPDYVLVNPGNNIMQMIQDYPENTKFKLDDNFTQDCGIEAVFAKPCTLLSTRGTLRGLFYPKPNTHFIGITLNGGNPNTILTGADDVTLDACVLNGNSLGQHRGILANCANMKIRNTRILNIARDIDT